MNISPPDYATYRGMLDVFQQHYNKLEQIISNTRNFFWHPSDPEEYLGPINPTGIVFSHRVSTDKNTGGLVDNSCHMLILAENVAPEFCDPTSGVSTVIFTPLNHLFNLSEYNESTNVIKLIQFDYCHNRQKTIEGLCRHEAGFYKLVWNAKISIEDKLRWSDENPPTLILNN